MGLKIKPGSKANKQRSVPLTTDLQTRVAVSSAQEQPLVSTHCCRLEQRFSTRTLAMLATRVPLSRVSLPRVSRVVLAITCTVSHVSSPPAHGRSMATRLHALLLVLLLHVKHVTPANTYLRIGSCKLVPQIDPSVAQPVVQSRRRPLLRPSPG